MMKKIFKLLIMCGTLVVSYNAYALFGGSGLEPCPVGTGGSADKPSPASKANAYKFNSQYQPFRAGSTSTNLGYKLESNIFLPLSGFSLDAWDCHYTYRLKVEEVNFMGHTFKSRAKNTYFDHVFVRTDFMFNIKGVTADKDFPDRDSCEAALLSLDSTQSTLLTKEVKLPTLNKNGEPQYTIELACHKDKNGLCGYEDSNKTVHLACTQNGSKATMVYEMVSKKGLLY